jgi:hypothetical protein
MNTTTQENKMTTTLTTLEAKIRQQEKWVATLYHAQESGDDAARGFETTPMIVYTPLGARFQIPICSKSQFTDETPDLTKPTYYVPDGPCGFAWVNLKAQKGIEGQEARKFINWLIGRTAPAARGCGPVLHPNYHVSGNRSYYGGHDIWVRGFDQSVQRKSAAAYEISHVLQGNIPGLRCCAMDRLD